MFLLQIKVWFKFLAFLTCFVFLYIDSTLTQVL